MRNKITIFALAIALIGLVSCEKEGRVYNENQDLSPLVEWLQVDSREFIVPIAAAGDEFDMSISFRYIYGYQHNVTKVKMTETTPGGEVNSYELALTCRDELGDYIGFAGGDIWDSEHLVFPKKKFEEAGNYTYKLEHAMEQEPLQYCLEIGVILDEVK
jgi:gliding motility-associated lipoprotein GldH